MDEPAEAIVVLEGGGEVLARFTCEGCGAPFVPKSKRHRRTCGATRCRDRIAYLDSRKNLNEIVADSDRCRRWAENNLAYALARRALRRRGLLDAQTIAQIAPLKKLGAMSTHDALAHVGLDAVVNVARTRSTARQASTERTARESTTDAWSVPSPVIEGPVAHAARLVLSVDGEERARVRDFVGARFLHGALHRALDLGHSLDATPVSLVLPSPKQPGLWMLTTDATVLDRLPARVRLAADPVSHDLRIAVRSRLRAPVAREPGQYRARLVVQWPLSMRYGMRSKPGRPAHALRPTPTEMGPMLERVARRAGITVDATAIIARVIGGELTELDGGVQVGSHWGAVACALGRIDLECNALGRWLLDLAALIGLGSCTSIGFGRVSVEEL